MPRSVPQLGSIELRELQDAREPERCVDRIDLLGCGPDPALDLPDQPVGRPALELDANHVAEPPPPQPSSTASRRSAASSDTMKCAFRVTRKTARSSTSTPEKRSGRKCVIVSSSDTKDRPLTARLPREDAEVQRQRGDVGKRRGRTDGEWRQDREDLALEPLRQRPQVTLGKVVRCRHEDALIRERGLQVVVPQR